MSASRLSRMVVGAAAGLVLAAGIASLALSARDAEFWQGWGEDGMLSEAVAGKLARAARGAGFLLALAGAGLFALRARAAALLETALARLAAEARAFASGLGADRQGLAVLAVIVLAGAWARWAYLSRPIQVDEAVTYLSFASRPCLVVLSDYSEPNNHIFHTLLVRAATRFGMTPPWIRLPAFLAGLAILPLIYVLGGRLYGREAGLLAAALAAGSAALVDYSTDGRGYSLVTLFTLLAWLNAASVLRRPGLWAWIGLVVWPALGFWTVPVMLYPAAAVYLWLAWNLWREGRAAVWKPLIAAGAASALLAVAFYLPVFLARGLRAVTANPHVRPLGWDSFFSAWPRELAHMLRYYTLGWPAALCGVLAAGILASQVLPRPAERRAGSILAPALFVVLGGLLLQRRYPIGGLGRIWLFLIPLALLEASAGLVAGVQRLMTPERTRGLAAVAAVALAFSLGLRVIGLGWITGFTTLPEPTHEEDESIALFVGRQLKPGDRFLVTGLSGTFRYYFRLHGFPEEALNPELEGDGDLFILRKMSGAINTATLDRELAAAADRYAPPERLRRFRYSELFRMKRVPGRPAGS